MFLRPSKTLKLIGLPLVCLAMFSVAGGHWALLQTIAWSQMLWSYSQQAGSVVLGAQKTFSGEYPCALCRSVAEGQKKENKDPQIVKADKKAEIFLVSFKRLVELPAPEDLSFPSVDYAFGIRSEAPPVPIPIA